MVDPQHGVFAAFPAADSYRVIVRDVDAEARKSIEALLPFRVHFDELGKHSLYVALRGRRPVGMIYVQREESAFGLAVVEWAFTFDMRVSSFRFQRVRSQHRQALEQSEFVRLLKGRTREELTVLLGVNGQLREPAKGVGEEAQELASAVVRSGAKSMAVLDAVWASEIAKLHDMATGLQAFPQAVSFRRVLPQPATTPDADVAEAKAAEVLIAIRAFGANSKPLGTTADIRMDCGNGTTVVSWVLDADDQVIRVDVAPDAPGAFRAACSDAMRKPLEVVACRQDAIGVAMKLLGRRLAPSPEPIPSPEPRPGR
ncbi:MAG: hypothetical protein KDC98_16545 [Planctomycetes bacterium]|nr:hypothetical protein [Planctomycetota bacterium]